MPFSFNKPSKETLMKSQNLIRLELIFAIIFSEFIALIIDTITSISFSYPTIHLFSSIILFIFLASFLSDFIRDQLRMISNLIFVFGILFVVYAAYISHFSKDSFFTLMLVFVFFSFMISSIRIFWILNIAVVATILFFLVQLNFETLIPIELVLTSTLLISIAGFALTSARIYYQQKIKEKERLLSHIFDNSYLGLLLFNNKNYKLLELNEKALEILNIEEKEDVIGLDIQEIEINGESLLADFKSQEKNIHELSDKRIIRINQQIISYNSKELLIVSLDEFKDVLALKKSADFLRLQDYSNQSYQYLFEENASYMCIFNSDNIIIDVNHSLCKLLGYRKNELLGKPCAYITFLEAENRVELNERAWSGEEICFEKSLKSKKGEKIELEVILRLGKYFGKEVLISNARNLNERKKIEEDARLAFERYYNVTNLSAIGFVVSDIEGNILEVNQAFLDFIGFSEEELKQIDIADLSHEEDYKQKKELGDLLISGEIQVGEIENRYYHKDGSVLYGLLKVILQRNKEGEAQFFFSQVVDITTIRTTQSELVVSEKSYKDLFNNSDDLLYILNRENKLLDVNYAVLSHYGYSKSEIIGRSPEIFSAPGQNDLDRLLHDMEKVWKGDRIEMLWWSVKKSGEVFPKELSIRKGMYLGDEVLIAKGKDISDSYLFERQLKEKEKRYRDLFERNLAGVYRTSENGEILECNAAFLNILGYHERDVFDNKINASDFYLSEEDRNNFLSKIKNKSYLKGEKLQLKKSSGENITVLVNVSSILDDQGNFSYFEGSFFDISDLEKIRQQLSNSEQKYKELIESASFGVLIIQENKIVFANSKSRMILSYSKDEELADLDISDIFLEEDKRIYGENIEKLNNHETIPFSNFTLKKKNGKLVDTEAKPSFIEFEGSTSLQFSFIDISDKRKIEAATEKIKSTEKFNSILQKQLHEKEVLLKEVHHRVKNNMQVISSILSLQSSYHQDEKVSKILEESQNRILTMALIHEKLYTTKDFSEISFDNYLEDLVRNIVESNKEKDAAIGLQFELDKLFLNLDYAIPLGLIVNELVTNTLKHAFKNRGEGLLTVMLKEKQGKEILLSIKDNGPGLDKLIDFKETDSLGLQLVNTLVGQLNGEIELIEDDGACFSINFNRFE